MTSGRISVASIRASISGGGASWNSAGVSGGSDTGTVRHVRIMVCSVVRGVVGMLGLGGRVA